MKIYGEGVANKSKSGQILDVYFPNIEFANKKTDAKNIDVLSDSQELIKLDWSEVDLKNPIEKVSDAYFKLHLISNKFVLPNTINLDGLFECLPNVAWTNIGPISIEEIEERLNKSKLEGNNFFIRSLDKFPCLTDYVIPKKVRVAGLIARATASESSGVSNDIFNLAQKQSFIDVYTDVGLIAIGCGIFLAVITPILKRLMHGTS